MSLAWLYPAIKKRRGFRRAPAFYVMFLAVSGMNVSAARERTNEG
jgi:hypothetical protein